MLKKDSLVAPIWIILIPHNARIPVMGQRIKGQEDLADALKMLEHVNAILDYLGLDKIAVHADYTKQLLDQHMRMVSILSLKEERNDGRSV